MIRSFTSSEELKIRTIIVSKPLNLAVHWPSKVWPVGMITDDCSTVEKNLKKLITPLDRKKYLNLVFYDNRNLKISNSKKSERYFRDKIEIFIRLFDELFVRHRYHRFPWRNLPPPPPLPPPTRWLVNFMPVAHVVLTLNLEFMSTMCLHEYRCILFLQLLFQFVASVLRL